MEGSSIWPGHYAPGHQGDAPGGHSVAQAGTCDIPYLENIFHAQASFSQVCLTRDVSLGLHFSLGFIINLKKFNLALVPTPVVLHLGGMIDKHRGLVHPPPVRVDAIVQAVQELMRSTAVSARTFMRITRLMASFHALISLCLFCLRPVLIHLADHYDRRYDLLTKPTSLNRPVLRAALEFWAELPRLAQGVLLHRPLPTVTLAMGASEQGFPARKHSHTLLPIPARDGEQCVTVRTPLNQWCLVARPDPTPHQLFLELLAVFLTLKRFRSMVCGQHVLLQRDNSTVVFYLNKGGGRDKAQESEPVGSPSDTLVHWSADCSPPHSGGQCGGGSQFTPQSAQDRSFDRVVFRSDDSSPSLPICGVHLQSTCSP